MKCCQDYGQTFIRLFGPFRGELVSVGGRESSPRGALLVPAPGRSGCGESPACGPIILCGRAPPLPTRFAPGVAPFSRALRARAFISSDVFKGSVLRLDLLACLLANPYSLR